MVSFIKVRSISVLRGSIITYKDIPSKRDKIILQLIQLCIADIKPCLFQEELVEPIKDSNDCINIEGEGECSYSANGGCGDHDDDDGLLS